MGDESNAYAKGYRAGQKSIRELYANSSMSREQFIDAAMLALIPKCFDAHNWKRGEEPITGGTDRMKLARELALDAWKQRVGA
jgi:hypothetical protein